MDNMIAFRCNNNSSWSYPHFQKDKLRFRERYYFHNFNFITPATTNIILIPDGVFLRTYLKLFEELFLQWNLIPTSTNNHSHSNKNNSDGKITSMFVQLILLESAAEWMDYRHSSVIIDDHHSSSRTTKKRTEAVAMQERSRILRLAETYTAKTTKIHNNNTTTAATVDIFPDLSYRTTSTNNDNNDSYCGKVNDDDDDDEMNVMQYTNMSIEHRSRCALVRAAKIYYQQLQTQEQNITTTKVWILTHDPLILSQFNDNDSNNNNIKAMTCQQFILSIKQQQISKMMIEKAEQGQQEHSEKWELLRQSCEEEYVDRNTPRTMMDDDCNRGHEPYISEKEMIGKNTNKYFRGTLQVFKQNVRQGQVTVTSNNNNNNAIQYFINDDYSRQHFNRCFHNDVVMIQPLPSYLWESPASNDYNNISKDEARTEIVVVPTARVVALKQSSRRQFVATLNNNEPSSTMMVIPMDPHIPKIRLNHHHTRNNINYINQRLLIQVDGWDMHSHYPHGHLIRVIGPIGDLETEVQCLLLEHGIQNQPFSPSALACLPSTTTTWKIPAKEINRRKDLRNTRLIFSVDPPGCQDIDDAMHAQCLPNGDIEIGVHIADVTHFLPQGSALDKEACLRATTFYFVDRRFDMLPSLLSSDLCSLHGHMDRLAVSYIWTMSSDFKEIKSSWYGRTIIHNFQAMTYDQAHNILLDKNPDDTEFTEPPPLTAGGRIDRKQIPQLKKALSILTMLARKLRRDRETIGGAVDLSSGDRGTELKFTLDEDGNPIKVSNKKDMEIHHTIAELMILANGHVATTIHERFPESALLRVHRAVGADQFRELQNLFKISGMAFDGKTNRALADSLKSSKQGALSEHGSAIDSVIQSLATRAMSEAQYICTGMTEDGVDLTHYGLGIKKYTHFTSPIRRYADVVVHRLLLATIMADRPNVHKFKQMSIRNQLISLPDSQTMSVLTGEGKLTQNKNLLGHHKAKVKAPFPVQDISAVASRLDTDANIRGQEIKNTNSYLGPYGPNETAKLCKNLNKQNRMAKISSMECQHLFLSLYLRENVDTATAVILSFRQNGMIVYVPKFDIKGPVFLCDRYNNVQIRPQIIGLPTNSGLPPSSGFTVLDGCRLIPEGKCILHNQEDEKNQQIELTVPDTHQTRRVVFKIFDVITVQLSCDLSENTARIPRPRLLFYSLEKNEIRVNSKQSNNKVINVNSSMIKSFQRSRLPDVNDKSNATCHGQMLCDASLNQVINSIGITPELVGVSLRMKNKEKRNNVMRKTQSVPGRLIFGDFRNPDTDMGVQEAAYNAASEARTTSSTHSELHYSDFDSSRKIEREAMARSQRLAAGKRNTRRAKAGK